MLILYIIGKIILYLLLILLIVFLAILVIPFKYNFSGQKMESTLLEGSTSWLFGGLKIRFKYSSENATSVVLKFLVFEKKLDGTNQKKQSKKASDKKEKVKKKKNDKKNAYSYLVYEVIEKGIRTIIKILNHCKPRQLHLEAKVGFDDPMYTGLLYAIKGTGFAILNKYNIHLEPTFEEEDLKGSFIIGGSIQIFYLLLVAIGFVFTKPFKSILFKNTKINIKRRLKKWQNSILVKT